MTTLFCIKPPGRLSLIEFQQTKQRKENLIIAGNRQERKGLVLNGKPNEVKTKGI